MQPRKDLSPLAKKYNYLCQAYDFRGLSWDKALRSGQQMVSCLLNHDEATYFYQLILKIECPTNQASIKIVNSRDDKTKYRVLIYLDHFDLEAANKHMQHKQAVILDFLNAIHCPTWREESGKPSESQWQIHHGEICFYGPSCGYYPDLEIGKPVSEWLFNCFDNQAVRAGFSDEVIEKFKHHLKTEDHKRARVHFFKNNHFVLGELFLLAQVYCFKKLAPQTQAFTQGVATGALSTTGLPPEICQHIGLFMQPAAAVKLAQVNQGAANAAALATRQFKDKAEEQLATYKGP